MFKRLTHNPHTNLLTGVVLFATAGWEVFNTFTEFEIGAHHGIFLYSVVNILKTLPELMHGAENLERL